MARTRRGFLGGLAAAGTAQVLAPALAGAVAKPVKPCTPTPPSIRTVAMAVAPGGRTIWTADNAGTTITAHHGRTLARGRSIDVHGAPVSIAISPSGHLALVVTAFYDRPRLAIVNLVNGQTDHIDVGPEPYAVVYAPDGKHAYVVGGGHDGTITRVDPGPGHVHHPIPVGRNPRGLAMHPDGRHALVALNGASAVAFVTLRNAKVRRIATGLFPYMVAVSPNGEHALVTHNGFHARTITPIDIDHRRAGHAAKVGADPTGIAYTASGRHAIVAAMGSRSVVFVDGRTGRVQRTVRQRTTSPRSVAVAGSRAIVADGSTGQLNAIRLGLSR